MRKIITLFILSLSVTIVYGQLSGSGTHGDGYYGTMEEGGDVTWSSNTYIAGDITVDDEKLTISAGVNIIFQAEGADLKITGTGQLDATGTSENMITFTADDDDDGNYGETGERWGHLSFEGSTGSSTLSYCIIEYGYKTGTGIEGYGGGIYANISNFTISNCIIQSNVARYGGGIFVNKSQNPSISNCIIRNNSVSFGGGGLYFWNDSYSTVSNCLIYNNAANNPGSYGGGSIFIGPSSGSVKIINCTSIKNTAKYLANEIYLYNSPNAKIINSIIWGSDMPYYGATSSSFEYCAIQGGYPSGSTGCINLNSDNSNATGPNFINPSSNHYGITVLSTCRDAGTSSGAPSTDITGQSRIGSTDIGAYENVYTKWTGGTTDWGTSGNWDNGLPSTTLDALIPDLSNDPVINSTVTANNVQIESGAVLSLSSGQSFTANCLGNAGSYTMNPTAQSTISSYIANTGTINLNSNSSGMFSLMFENYSGSGTVNSEIYFTGGDAGSGAYRWHYMAVPKTMNKSELLSDISTDNLLLYDDSKVSTSKDEGWQWHDGYNETTGFTNLDETRGYNFYHSNTSGETATLTSTSLLSTIGNITLQNSNPSSNLFGWNLVGNSLTCAIDWDEVDFSSANVRNAVYYTKDNSMAAYVSGEGVNGGTQYIPPLQGFFVKTTADEEYITLTDAKIHKTDQAYYKKGKSTSSDNSVIRMKIVQGENIDEMLIRFEKDGTDQFDYQYDASKWISPASIPQIYTLLLNNDYCINTVDYPEDNKEITVGIKIPVDGNYIIKQTDIANLEDYNIYLKDLQQNVTVNLKDIPEYNFSGTTGTDVSRFVIKVSNIATATDEIIFSKKEFNIYSAFGLINIQTLGDEWNGKQGMIKVFDLAGKTISDISNAEFDKNSIVQIGAPETKGLYLVEIKAGVKRYVGKVVIK